ncbi:hypothetical protein C8Q69DRAFT_157193 [Paecilomyces variotii]|uniref:Uncharacterized protein n=1 Tax=Byssochlamys spectabilis TaxID=264951 RepID=A0A443I1U1_BYSSP|nr:hypothetical protein C8Q69DRAFT_157193 [Paecilomyces variotii]RWQ98011.1 hypothetical protein C8Q69DRAFT_157193 [Paecilomyces variotii]
MQVDVQSPDVFFEAINIRNRGISQLPERYIGKSRNYCLPAPESRAERLTVKEVVEDALLSKLAAYIRNITDGVDSAFVYQALDTSAGRIVCFTSEISQHKKPAQILNGFIQ